MPTSVVVRDDTTVTVLATSFALLILGTLFEVPLTTLALGVLAVAIQTWLGSEVYRRIIQEPDPHIDELIGMGFAVGSLLVVTIDQVVVRTPLRDFWWWTLPLVALVLSVRRTRTFVWTPSNFAFLLLAERTMWLCAFGTLLLVQERYWPLWIGIALLAVAICLHKLRTTSDGYSPKWRGTLVAAAIATVGIIWRVIDWRPPNWWIKTADFQFFEALGFSLSHFGAQDQVFAAGEPVKYHWLSYAWTGMLDRVIGAEHWVVITRLGPVIVALTLYFLASTVARHLDLGGRWLAFALSLFVLLNDFNFESFSMVFSYIWLLALFNMVVQRALPRRPSTLLLFAILGAAAFAAKSSNIVVILGLVTTSAMTGATSLRTAVRQGLPLVVAALGSLAATYVYFLASSGYSELVELGISGFAQDLFGDIGTLALWPRTVAAVIVLVNALILFIVALSALLGSVPHDATRRPQKLSDSPLVLATALCLMGSGIVLAIFVAPYHEQEEYFLHAFAIIGVFCVAAAVQSFWQRPATSNQPARIAIGTSAVVTALLVLLTPTNDGTTFAMFVRVVLDSHMFLICLVFVLALSMLFIGKAVTGTQFVSCLLIAALSSSAVASNDQWIRQSAQFKAEIQDADHTARYLGGEDVIAGAKLIRALTLSNDVIASNHFCEQTWCPTDEYVPNRSNWLKGGEALGLVVYSERRYLVSGYGFTWQNIVPPAEVLRRIQWSLDPHPRLLKVNESVTPRYFLRDLTMPCLCDGLSDAEEIGMTPRFVLYRLDA